VSRDHTGRVLAIASLLIITGCSQKQAGPAAESGNHSPASSPSSSSSDIDNVPSFADSDRYSGDNLEKLSPSELATLTAKRLDHFRPTTYNNLIKQNLLTTDQNAVLKLPAARPKSSYSDQDIINQVTLDAAIASDPWFNDFRPVADPAQTLQNLTILQIMAQQELYTIYDTTLIGSKETSDGMDVPPGQSDAETTLTKNTDATITEDAGKPASHTISVNVSRAIAGTTLWGTVHPVRNIHRTFLNVDSTGYEELAEIPTITVGREAYERPKFTIYGLIKNNDQEIWRAIRSIDIQVLQNDVFRRWADHGLVLN
jgi:hypothetical protein